MKLHWGHGIFLFYLLFVAALVVVVVKSRQFDNSLVTEAYYERDINYQQEFDRRRNSQLLPETVRLVSDAGAHQLVFPQPDDAPVAGTVLLYRPSGKADDRRLPITVADGKMDLYTRGLPAGRYVAVVEWSRAGTDYYDELDLHLN